MQVAAQPESYNKDVQSIVDELKGLSQKARQERSADRWVLDSLDGLIRDYDWPWQKRLIVEEFADGDFTHEPSWEVRSGRYWIDGPLGLRSRITVTPEPEPASEPEEQEEQDVGKALLEGLLRSVLESQDTSPEPESVEESKDAEIVLPLEISNAFAIRMLLSIHSESDQNGRLLFGVSQGTQSGEAYLLALQTGKVPRLELVRVRDGRSAIIESVVLDESPAVGKVHRLEWRRDDYGLMQLLLDGKQVARISDRGLKESFQRFNVVNVGGDYAIRRLVIFGN